MRCGFKFHSGTSPYVFLFQANAFRLLSLLVAKLAITLYGENSLLELLK